MTMEWDPQQYDKFRAAREQPFADVVALIEKVPRPRIVDLGCGPGNLTRRLLEHFPDGDIVGIDTSEAMLQKARELSAPGLGFVQLDIEAFAGGAVGGTFDVIFSNAALHWVLDHATLLPKLAAAVLPACAIDVAWTAVDKRRWRMPSSGIATWAANAPSCPPAWWI